MNRIIVSSEAASSTTLARYYQACCAGTPRPGEAQGVACAKAGWYDENGGWGNGGKTAATLYTLVQSARRKAGYALKLAKQTPWQFELQPASKPA